MTMFFRFLFCFAVLALAPMSWWAQNGWSIHRPITSSAFRERGGVSFEAEVPVNPFTTRLTDRAGHENESDLRAFENGKELGPGHVAHLLIASDGHGSFDDWNGSLVVSASDNSDVRSNGKSYSVTFRLYPSHIAYFYAIGACFGLALLCCVVNIMLMQYDALKNKKRPGFVGGYRIAIFILCLVICFLSVHGIEVRRVIPVGDVTSWGGAAYHADLSDNIGSVFYSTSDDEADGFGSEMKMIEDGKPLGPAHAIHDTIRKAGKGAFSNWKSGVVFSASDNSDPTTNGRVYRAEKRFYLNRLIAVGLLVLASIFYIKPFVWRAFEYLFRRSPRLIRTLEPVSTPVATQWMVRFVGMCVVYFILVFAVVASLTARQDDKGGYKINFEYKVF